MHASAQRNIRYLTAGELSHTQDVSINAERHKNRTRPNNPMRTQESVKNKVSALILAGGAGRRVGGADKGLLQWHGKRLIDHVYERVQPQVASVIVSCNRNVETYQAIAPTVTDSRARLMGPLAGIESAAPLIETEFLLVVACDTPRIPLDLVFRLTKPLLDSTSAHDIAYAHCDTRAHYLCAAIRASRLQAVSRLLNEGVTAVRDWYAQERTLEVQFQDAGAFKNLNRVV